MSALFHTQQAASPPQPAARVALLQRKCACGGAPGLDGECAACKAKRMGLQRSAAAPGPALAPPVVHQALRGAGQPLDGATRAAMEPRLGHDFSRVRVHTDATADASARAVGAHAYTVGRHIVFAAGQYAPGSSAGRHLLAHELAHVAQQGGAQAPEAQARLEVGAPGDQAEHEAERAAARATAALDGPSKLESSRPGLLQRQTVDIPVFDEFDPCLIVPEGLPSPFDLLGGQQVCGSTAKAIRDFLRGKKPDGKADCRGFEGFTPGGSKEFLGQCCRGIESKENCCPPDRIGAKELSPRCCKEGEVVSDGKCVKSSSLPTIDFCLPSQKTLDGRCCLPPLVPQGIACVLPRDKPPPPPPNPPTPLPSALEIFFQRDRPTTSQSGGAGLRASATSAGVANFDSLVAQLKADPSLRVQLVGKASPEGAEEYNLTLAGRRANLVADALVAAGIAADRITNPPEADLRAECQELRVGVFTCGEAGATGPSDRQVLARVFPAP